MGTRNITRVILPNGSVIVNQYCQWDGYPTGRGVEVMDFVRQYCTKAKLEELTKRLNESTLYMAVNGQDNCSSTGAHQNKTSNRVIEMSYQPGFEGYGKLLKKGKITDEEMRVALQHSRDFGPRILYWLMEKEEKGMAFYTDDYCYNVSVKGDWQIEGVFVIDLSKNKVTIGYHGKRRTYSFKKVCAWTEDEIKAEMEAFEKYADGEK